MANLRWKELFRALFLAGFLGYLAVAVTGQIWVGIPMLLAFGWLCYDFRRKVSMFKRITWLKTGEEFKRFTRGTEDLFIEIKKETKECLWDNNPIKVCSLVLSLVLIMFMAGIPSWVSGERNFLVLVVCCLFVTFTFYCGLTLLVIISCDKQVTDKKIAKFLFISLPLFFVWKLPKFLIKTSILTIAAVHSVELVAAAVYSLAGMIYIILFPSFALAPAQIFLMAIGCGLFTGAVGLAIHKVLLTATAQTVFAKVEAW